MWIDGDCFLGESAMGFLWRCVYCMRGLEFLLNKKLEHFEISVLFLQSSKNFLNNRQNLKVRKKFIIESLSLLTFIIYYKF